MDAFVLDRLLLLAALWMSLTIHEWAHAWSAFLLGDDTAMRLGRMSFNPLVHVDPIGTFLLPLIGIPFGWAKPVPVNPTRFRQEVSMDMGMLLTAAAGPISNLVLAAVAITAAIAANSLGLAVPSPFDLLLTLLVQLNVILALFNLLPVPPLDGSRIADALMPESLRPAWDSFCSLGPAALLAVILIPGFLGFSPFGWILNAVLQLLP